MYPLASVYFITWLWFPRLCRSRPGLHSLPPRCEHDAFLPSVGRPLLHHDCFSGAWQPGTIPRYLNLINIHTVFHDDTDNWTNTVWFDFVLRNKHIFQNNLNFFWLSFCFCSVLRDVARKSTSIEAVARVCPSLQLTNKKSFIHFSLPRISCQFVCVESLVTAVVDMYPAVFRRKNRRELFLLAVSLFSFFMGLIMLMEVGVTLWDHPHTHTHTDAKLYTHTDACTETKICKRKLGYHSIVFKTAMLQLVSLNVIFKVLSPRCIFPNRVINYVHWNWN